MGLDELVARREELLSVGRAHGAVSVRVFGSTARGTAGPASDVDFLVELEPGRTLLDLVALGPRMGRAAGPASRRDHAEDTPPAARRPDPRRGAAAVKNDRPHLTDILAEATYRRADGK